MNRQVIFFREPEGVAIDTIKARNNQFGRNMSSCTR
jgi:hypothetical protein